VVDGDHMEPDVENLSTFLIPDLRFLNISFICDFRL